MTFETHSTTYALCLVRIGLAKSIRRNHTTGSLKPQPPLIKRPIGNNGKDILNFPARRPQAILPMPSTPGVEGCCAQRVCDRIYLQGTNDALCAGIKNAIFFSIDSIVHYQGFCDDFGPMNLGVAYDFFKLIDTHLHDNPEHLVIMQSKLDGRALTNAVFLLGSYLIVKESGSLEPDDILMLFWSVKHRLLSFRDVSPNEQNFHLHLRDCWAGLCRAKQLGWVKQGFHGFDATRYAHHGEPLNADLHEIVPGKLVAFRGPRSMPHRWHDVTTGDGHFSQRDFNPVHYVDILRRFNVQAVVRLNLPEYRQEIFTEAGLGFADLFFEDCTCPPVDIVAKFTLIAECLPGALAVHCKSGLGRTGTLIALYIMQHYGFKAREAIGWLRIVRPGSVIGQQQQYLVDREAVMQRSGARYREEGGVCASTHTGETTTCLISEAMKVVDERMTRFNSNAKKAALLWGMDQPSSIRGTTGVCSDPIKGRDGPWLNAVKLDRVILGEAHDGGLDNVHPRR